MRLGGYWGTTVLAILLSGCAEEIGPLEALEGRGLQTEVQAVLNCAADLQASEISCSHLESQGGGASGAVIGGQGTYLLLESSNIRYDAGGLFQADIRIRNFLTDPLGTPDGRTADPAGIRIFFVDEPQVTGGTGQVTVNNADGVDIFTGSSQPYFRYPAILSPGQSSDARVWRWNVPSTVEAFTFQVGVSASVPDESSLVPGMKLMARTLSVGHEHSCALDQGGQAYCWGANSNGQLGVGTAGDRPTPTPVAGGLSFVSISAGVDHTCAIAEGGAAYCWGAGTNNRTGISSVADQYQPVAVAGGLEFVSISAGNSHSCGISIDGDAYCWGGGGNGKVGRGSTAGSPIPAMVVGGLKYQSISAGYYNTCAITVDQTAVCWGNGNGGRSGDGNTGTHNIFNPTPIDHNARFVQISAGSAYTCALTVDGDTYCFGLNGSGQQGNGSTTGTGVPTLVSGGHHFSSVAARFSHTCATTSKGEAFCWGNNEWGRLGVGDTLMRLEPVRVDGVPALAEVGVGRYHSCGIDAGGSVYCWGRGSNAYQLGTGRATDHSLPVPVSTARERVLDLVQLAGDGESAIFGQVIEASVRVESAGLPLPGAAVAFSISSGKGTLSDTLIVAGADGVATVIWQPGIVAGLQRLEADAGSASVEFTADVTAPVPGRSYLGRNGYVEYIAGELPIILSSPHAGLLTPDEIPNRTSGTTVRDGEVHDLTTRTAAALERLTGKRPHIALMHLRRTKIDANREIVEAAQGSPFAERAWYEYHGWIEISRSMAAESAGRGFYIDMHGHGHPERRLELGYLLTSRELALSDSEINKSQYVNKSSIRTLASSAPGGLVELLRGEDSFGEILVRNGYRAVPSRSEPDPAGEPYFTGGYSTVRHGSRGGGVIDGVQIEHHNPGLRDNAANRQAYADALARSILEYLEKWMGLEF